MAGAYPYARPLTSAQWKNSPRAPVGGDEQLYTIITGVQFFLPTKLQDGCILDDLKIFNMAHESNREKYYEWVESLSVEDSDFLWSDSQHCKPPLIVAIAARRVARAIEVGDPATLRLIEDHGHRERMAEWREDAAATMHHLADFCEWAAAEGATEVTVAWHE